MTHKLTVCYNHPIYTYVYNTAPRRAQIQFIYKVAGRESSTRVFGTRVTPQRERKYNSANYACHRKPLSAARICEIVSPPNLQKYIATQREDSARGATALARSLIQGERIRELLGFGLGREPQERKRKRTEEKRHPSLRSQKYNTSKKKVITNIFR